MNIAFINSTRKWGGVKTWTLDVARGLADRGHSVFIVGRPGPFTDKAKELGLNTLPVTFGPDFNPALILRFLRLFKARNIDRVMINVGKDMRTAGVAARLLDIPVIHRVGLAGDMENTFKVRAMHKWVKPRILVPCEQIRQGLLQELPYLSPDEITVILTGKEPAPAPPKTVHSPLRLISTSQLNADKGHREVLTALAELKKQGLGFEYHIVGTGRIEQELKELAHNLGLRSEIVWHGFQKDVRARLAECDVFILASHKEGLPNSLLEAMSMGLACVATDVGGVREVWSETLIPLVPASSPQILVRTLKRILNESPFGIRGQQSQTLIHAQKAFSLERTITSMETWLDPGQ
jgi:glycosyltransferase involved in cell wall biosynthesis